jgi:hypothetical protein
MDLSACGIKGCAQFHVNLGTISGCTWKGVYREEGEDDESFFAPSRFSARIIEIRNRSRDKK